MGYPTYREAATRYPQEAIVTTPPNATFALGGGVAISAGGSSQNSSGVTFSNSNNISFGLSAGTITASASFPPGGIAVSGGTQSFNTGTLVFVNSNSISFGLNNHSLTASVAYPVQTSYVFSNDHGITFGTAGSTVTASFSSPPSATSLVYSNSNNITFGTVGSTLTASASFSQSVQTQNSVLVNGSSGSIVFSNSNGVTFGGNNRTITASFSTAPQTAYFFSNSNGISFGTNGSTVTASYTSPPLANSSATISAGVSSETISNVVFSNSNGISFGLSAGTITATVKTDYQSSNVNYLTSQSNQVLSGSNGSFTFQTATFGNLNGFSFYTSNGSMVGSYTVPSVTNSSLTGSAGIKSETLSQIVFSNSNGVSFGLTGGTFTATVKTDYQSSNANYLTSQSSQIVSAANGSYAFQTLLFSNANGLSFGTSGGSAITASYTVPTLTAFVFSNSNNVSFGTNASTVTASASFSQSAQTQSVVQGLIAGTQTGRTGDISFANSNGITFGMSGSNTITASYTVPSQTAYIFSNSNNVSFGTNGSTITATASFNQTNQTLGLYALGNTTQNSSTTLDARTVSLNALGALTAGYSNGSIQLSVPATSSLSGAGIISLSVVGSTIIISASAAGAADGYNIIAAGTQTANTTGSVLFSNSNGISFGMSNSSIITASYTVPSTAGLISAVNISAGTTSNNLSALTFSNSNGISFGLNGSVITGTVATNYQSQGAYLTTAAQSTQTLAFSLGGNSATTNSSNITAGGYVLAGGNGVTLAQSNNTLSFSVATNYQSQGAYLTTAALSNHSHGNPTLALTNLTGTTASASNGFTLSLSAAPPSAALINLSAGTTSNNLTAFTLSNSNGLAFGLNGSVVTGSYTVPTQSVVPGIQSIQVSNTTYTTGNVIFSNANGVSFGSSAGGAITASYTVPSTAGFISAINISAGTTSNNLTAATFSNANGVSFGLNGSVVTATVATNYQSQGAYLTTAMQSNAATISNINVSAGTTSNNLSALTFSNGSGVSFGLNGSVLTATVQTNYLTTAAQSTQTLAFSLGGNSGTTNSSILSAGGYVIAGGNNITLSMSNNSLSIHGGAGGGGGSYNILAAGTQTAATTGTVVFSNSNGISFGMSNSSIITASYTVPTQTNQTLGLYALGNTTQNSSTTLDARTVSYNGLGAMTVGYSNGSVQLSAPATSSLSGTGQVSVSANGSTIFIGVPNAGTKSGYSPYGDLPYVLDQVGQSSIIFDPEYLPNLQFDRVQAMIYNSNATNSSGSHSISIHFGIYTRNVSTLSLLASASGTFGASHSGTAGNYSLYSGMRMLTIGMTTTVTDGQYWLAFMSRTASGGTGGTYSNIMISNLSSSTNNFNGWFGSAASASVQMTLGGGIYSAQTAALPASVAFSQINGTGTAQLRFPIIRLASSTV